MPERVVHRALCAALDRSLLRAPVLLDAALGILRDFLDAEPERAVVLTWDDPGISEGITREVRQTGLGLVEVQYTHDGFVRRNGRIHGTWLPTGEDEGESEARVESEKGGTDLGELTRGDPMGAGWSRARDRAIVGVLARWRGEGAAVRVLAVRDAEGLGREPGREAFLARARIAGLEVVEFAPLLVARGSERSLRFRRPLIVSLTREPGSVTVASAEPNVLGYGGDAPRAPADHQACLCDLWGLGTPESVALRAKAHEEQVP
jgi:hypothetical protein